VPAVLGLVADAPDHAVLLEELPYPRTHYETEVRVPIRLSGDELEEVLLRHHRDVRILSVEVG
jgi:hypothetical protein